MAVRTLRTILVLEMAGERKISASLDIVVKDGHVNLERVPNVVSALEKLLTHVAEKNAMGVLTLSMRPLE